jgi:short-subunit dehydrogenase
MAQDIALVTGASSGIGEAIARRIARDGRDVTLVARRADRLAAVARELEQAHGIRAHVIAKDLIRAGATGELLEEIADRGLTVDWLVNNAGFGTVGRFDQLPVEGELDEIRLNVEVLVELTGRCLPGMVGRGRGVVMNIASLGGFAPGPYMATYAATKAFVLSFSEAIATELRGTGVQVLCVCPGFTRTEFQQKAEVDVSNVPDFVWMSAAEVADQAVRAVGRGPVLVNGVLNSLAASTVRFAPRGLLTRVVAGFLKPKEAR